MDALLKVAEKERKTIDWKLVRVESRPDGRSIGTIRNQKTGKTSAVLLEKIIPKKK